MADNKLGVAVVTTSGRWPASGSDAVNDNVKVRVVLDDAARNLKITDTTGWIATVAGTTKELNQDASFKDNGITGGDIIIDYGPRNPGGGGLRA